MHDEEHWLQVLGLGREATKRQIEDAYHDLVKVWHPDRFQSDPDLCLKAEEKLRELNEAYDGLLRSPRPPADRSTAARTQSRSDFAHERPAEPKEGRPRKTAVRMFTGVLLATAVFVGALLFLETRRDTITAADVPIASDPIPPRARPPGAERSEPEAPAPPPAAPTTGTLAVFSQPSGATVYVNDEHVGQTPLTLTAIGPGVHQIRLELDDHPAWSSSVRIEAGGGEKLLAIFEKSGQ